MLHVFKHNFTNLLLISIKSRIIKTLTILHRGNFDDIFVEKFSDRIFLALEVSSKRVPLQSKSKLLLSEFEKAFQFKAPNLNTKVTKILEF